MRPEDIELPATTSISIPLGVTYERMLRFYPPEWRAQNGAAMVGALLDQAEDEQRDRPTMGDRVSLVAGGLQQTFLSTGTGSRWSLLPLGAAAALSAFYFSISWAPGLQYPGAFGSFANPSVIAAALIIVSFGSAVFSMYRTSRVLSLIAIIVELVVGVIAARENWMGPNWTTVVLFVGLAALGIGPVRRARTVLLGISAVMVIVAVAIFAPTLWYTLVDLAAAAL
jgi:hypothetical protein